MSWISGISKIIWISERKNIGFIHNLMVSGKQKSYGTARISDISNISFILEISRISGISRVSGKSRTSGI